MRTKVGHQDTGLINPIFYLGKRSHVFMSTGHKSPEMMTFMHKFFGKEKCDVQINNSVVGKVGEQQKYQVTV